MAGSQPPETVAWSTSLRSWFSKKALMSSMRIAASEYCDTSPSQPSRSLSGTSIPIDCSTSVTDIRAACTIQFRTSWSVVTAPVSATALLVLWALSIESGGGLASLGNPLSQTYVRPW
eukprot:SAG22_NODE_41_length_25488_cov_6.133719_4_plen_118_part_00